MRRRKDYVNKNSAVGERIQELHTLVYPILIFHRGGSVPCKVHRVGESGNPRYMDRTPTKLTGATHSLYIPDPLCVIFLCLGGWVRACVLHVPCSASSPFWTELTSIQNPVVQHLVDVLPFVLLSDVAPSTGRPYLQAFGRWRT